MIMTKNIHWRQQSRHCITVPPRLQPQLTPFGVNVNLKPREDRSHETYIRLYMAAVPRFYWPITSRHTSHAYTQNIKEEKNTQTEESLPNFGTSHRYNYIDMIYNAH